MCCAGPPGRYLTTSPTVKCNLRISPTGAPVGEIDSTLLISSNQIQEHVQLLSTGSRVLEKEFAKPLERKESNLLIFHVKFGTNMA